MDTNILVEVINYLDIKKVLIAIAVIYVINIIRNNAKKAAIAAKFMKIADEKRTQRDAQIATEHISPDEVPEQIRTLILNSTVTQLTLLLNEDKITSEQILKTYHSRAITLGHSLNLIGDSNYKEALELARKCDEKRRSTRREDRHTLGGLFGIPISIKDSFIQKGLDSTCGGAPMCFSPNQEDGAILALLKSKGAIPFIRSNVPQTLGLLDCMNYIWGRGQNPWNKERTPGGSSGGEGGLIAARCSPIGLGSDALGSIRVPAAFNGVIGFKPTMGRYLTKGHSKLGTYAASKMSASYFCNGPLSRTVDDATVFVKELITEEGRKYDPLSPYVPWSEEKYQSKKKLKIAYTVSEDFFGACKASQRAVREAVEGLKRLGHETIEIKIPNFERMIMLMVMITSSEGKGRGLIDFLQGEAPIKELKGQFLVKALPVFVKKAVKNIFRLQGLNRFAYVVEMAEELSVAEFHEKMNEYYELKDELLKFFTNNKYDAILTPAMPLPAFKHGHGMEIGLGSSYLWHANMANLVSGSVPVTLVKEGEDVYSKEDCIHHDRMFQHCQETIKGSVGLPLAVQVLTLPWEDEKCLAVMKAIESEVKFKGLSCL